MIPLKIEDSFIQLTIDFSGNLVEIVAGMFAIEEFSVGVSIYKTCPFLEATLDALPIQEPYFIERMLIVSYSKEYNVDVVLLKESTIISVTIYDRTNVYKYVTQLNQNRNDLFLIKREIAQKNKELEKLRYIADKANREKSRFLAVMSHEIRNPLNSILGYSEMILSEKNNAIVRLYSKLLTIAGKNLRTIVDDILDLSRIEAGKLELAIVPISIEEVVENCVNDFKYQQKGSEVTLRFSLAKQPPKFVLGDPVRLTQVLSNLIYNAIKFTKKGTISVEVNVLSEGGKNIVVGIYVADTGRGMSVKQTQKIFEEYQQIEPNDARLYGGSGLGLSIVKRLVKAMNGSISVESTPNIGTTFSIEILFKKIKKSLVHQVEVPVKKNESIRLKNKKILFADDDALNQTMVVHLLSKEKMVITTVNDGLDAFFELQKQRFDVVLLDINMPNMTGEQLMEKRKSFFKLNAQTPVLALTGNAMRRDVERYKNLGFSAVISKPYTSLELMEAIRNALL